MESITVLYRKDYKETRHISSGNIVDKTNEKITAHLRDHPQFKAVWFNTENNSGWILNRGTKQKDEIEIISWRKWEENNELQVILPNKDLDNRFASSHLSINGSDSLTFNVRKDTFELYIDNSKFVAEYDNSWCIDAEVENIKWEVHRPGNKGSNTLGFNSPVLYVGNDKLDDIEVVSGV